MAKLQERTYLIVAYVLSSSRRDFIVGGRRLACGVHWLCGARVGGARVDPRHERLWDVCGVSELGSAFAQKLASLRKHEDVAAFL
jgi:hypothetical protein